MKVGDLVTAGDPSSAPGIIVKIEDVERWEGFEMEVLVLWPEEEYGLSLEPVSVLEVVNANR